MTTLAQIQAKLKKLQAQEQLLIAKRNQSILNQIRKLMSAHDLTTADIEAHVSTPAKRRGRPVGSSTKAKAKNSVKTKASNSGGLPAKYRDPKTGATWSGWARPPLWIKDVRDRSKFLIDGNTEESTTTKTSGAGVKKTPVKRPAGKKASRKSSGAKARVTGDRVSAQAAPAGASATA